MQEDAKKVNEKEKRERRQTGIMKDKIDKGDKKKE